MNCDTHEVIELLNTLSAVNTAIGQMFLLVLLQETRNGVVLRVGGYGERCQCDNSSSNSCPVGRDLKLVCSGRSQLMQKLDLLVI